MAHDVGNDKSADCSCNQNSNSREDEDDESREGQAVWRGEALGKTEGSQNEDEEADHGDRVRNGGGDGKMLELCGREDASTRGMDGHGEKASEGAGDESDSGLTIVCHVTYCKEKNRFPGNGFCVLARYGTNEVLMSGNVDGAKGGQLKKAAAKVDRRIRRTRDTLGDALVALMQEKSFEEITVQEVLDRAGVGRSTFYAHYRDKEDLFLSDVEDFMEMMSTLLTRHAVSLERVAPVAELFAHITDVREFYAAMVASGKAKDVQELGQGFFARSIEERLRMAGVEMEPAELKAQAHALAGALFSLLDWWLDHRMTESPEAMDALFHRMVWSGVRVKHRPKP